jgi:ATP-dependent Clp protease adaptor protein ClpS
MISLRSPEDWRLDGDRLGGPKEPPGGPPQQPPRRDGGDGEGDNDGRTGALTLTRTRTKKPSMYKVLMLNDDYTPMEFVVDVLQNIFQKNREEATEIMLHVHQKGVGVCGVYTYEVAETKVTQTVDYARKNQHPLQCTLEKE